MTSSRRNRAGVRAALVIAFVAVTSSSCRSAAPPHTSVTTTTGAPVAPPSARIDVLDSWNEGPVKRAIIEFVTRVSSGAQKLPPEERIAVIDDDGTLWQEKPRPESAFVMATLQRMAIADPTMRDREPFKAALEHDAVDLHRQGPAALLTLLIATHSGMTDGAYTESVRTFLAEAQHPRFQKRYTELTYVPMIELLAYLQSRGFVTYLCSSGDVDFMRVFSAELYGIPPERVIGSRVKKEVETRAGQMVLRRRPEIESINDGDTRPVGIDRQIGRRPILAIGNVGNGGDIAMLRYTHDRGATSFGMVIDHDDDEREFAYSEPDRATLNAARDMGLQVVSMRRDWRVVFRERATR